MVAKNKKTELPDPLEAGNIPGQNPATPERMPGHTRFYDDNSGSDDKAAADTGEEEEELDAALEQTFPASDPIAAESTLVSGRRRR